MALHQIPHSQAPQGKLLLAMLLSPPISASISHAYGNKLPSVAETEVQQADQAQPKLSQKTGPQHLCLPIQPPVLLQLRPLLLCLLLMTHCSVQDRHQQRLSHQSHSRYQLDLQQRQHQSLFLKMQQLPR